MPHEHNQPPIPLSEDFDLYENVTLLPGWPGYRIRPGRSGLDWIDTQYEMAHMAGVFIRQLITGAWRRVKNGPHPLIVLIIGFALISATLGGEIACLVIPLMLLIVWISERYRRVSTERKSRKNT